MTALWHALVEFFTEKVFSWVMVHATAGDLVLSGLTLLGAVGLSRWIIRREYNPKLGAIHKQLASRSSDSDFAGLNEDKTLSNTKAIWLASPGAGRTAARLIMMVPTLEEAKQIHDGFLAAPKREHADHANWAILRRLEEKDVNSELVYGLAFRHGDEPINVDPATEQELTLLREKAQGD